jgi:hypothetical protein
MRSARRRGVDYDRCAGLVYVRILIANDTDADGDAIVATTVLPRDRRRGAHLQPRAHALEIVDDMSAP